MNRQTGNNDQSQNLNVGCGAHFHSSWCNVDLVSFDPAVRQHDIRQGLPFDDGTFEAVYHSHVLEHLTPDQGRRLIRECNRVLVPGGVMRVVVPDLEQIARLYLETLDLAWSGDDRAAENYEWMKLELLDQMVRHQSGGLMGPYMIDSNKSNREFVQSRIGDELNSCQLPPSGSGPRSLQKKSRKPGRLTNLRARIASRVVAFLLGPEKEQAFREGLFRQQGEIHRWMYDRFSLKDLCNSCGFDNFSICPADGSRIDGFAAFQLDKVGSQVRKPDSLFVECCKRRNQALKAA